LIKDYRLLCPVLAGPVTEVETMTSFYDLKAKKLTGEVVSMEEYKGKVVLVENTASL